MDAVYFISWWIQLSTSFLASCQKVMPFTTSSEVNSSTPSNDLYNEQTCRKTWTGIVMKHRAFAPESQRSWVRIPLEPAFFHMNDFIIFIIAISSLPDHDHYRTRSWPAPSGFIAQCMAERLHRSTRKGPGFESRWNLIFLRPLLFNCLVEI